MAKRTFILSEEMRASKSGFFVEGTDIEMDYPDAYPIPLETEVLEDGTPVALRVLPNCSYLEKELQVKNGYPASYRYTEADRKKLTFVHARLTLDDKRDKIWLDYLSRTAWMEGNEMKKPRQNTRTIFKLYDEEMLLTAQLDVEEMVIAAKSKVISLSEPELKDLYRLSVAGNFSEGEISPKLMRKHLLAVADANPEFISDGIKTTRDHLTVLVNKALEYKILRLDIPGQVAINSSVTNQWVNIVDITEAQGAQAKFDKFIEYLNTDMGKAELNIIETRVKEFEDESGEPRKEEIFQHDEDRPRKKGGKNVV